MLPLLERQDLHGHVLPLIDDAQQMSQLLPEHLPVSDGTAKHGFVKNGPEDRRLRARKRCLPPHPGFQHPPQTWPHAWPRHGEQGPRIGLCLEQTGNDVRHVLLDLERLLLQRHVLAGPVRERRPVDVTPQVRQITVSAQDRVQLGVHILWGDLVAQFELSDPAVGDGDLSAQLALGETGPQAEFAQLRAVQGREGGRWVEFLRCGH